MDTQLTKDCVARIVADYKTQVQGAIQREVDKAKTPQDAIRTVTKWERYLPAGAASKSYVYHGHTMPTKFELDEELVTYTDGRPRLDYQGKQMKRRPRIETTMWRDYYGKSYTREYDSIAVAGWPSSVWVHGYAPSKFTGQHKAKLRKWAADNSIGQDGSIDTFILLRGPAPKSTFIDPTLVVSWDTIKAIQLPKADSNNPNAGRIPGSFDIITEKGQETQVKGDDLRQDKPLFWQQGNYYECSGYATALGIVHKEFTVVCLPGNRVAKFQRDVPKATRASDGCVKAAEIWRKALTKDDLAALNMSESGRANHYARMDATHVDDPDLKRAITLAKKNVSGLQDQWRQFRSVAYSTTSDLKLEPYPHPLPSYPLYPSYGCPDAHSYWYLNAVYAARQKGDLK